MSVSRWVTLRGKCVRLECSIGMDMEADHDKCVDFSLELIELGFEEGLEL